MVCLYLIDEKNKFFEKQKLFKTKHGINLGDKKENKIVLFEKERKEDLIQRFNNIKNYVKKKISINKKKKVNMDKISLHKQKISENINRVPIVKKNIEFLDNHKNIENTLFGSIILKEKIQEFQSNTRPNGKNGFKP